MGNVVSNRWLRGRQVVPRKLLVIDQRSARCPNCSSRLIMKGSEKRNLVLVDCGRFILSLQWTNDSGCLAYHSIQGLFILLTVTSFCRKIRVLCRDVRRVFYTQGLSHQLVESFLKAVLYGVFVERFCARNLSFLGVYVICDVLFNVCDGVCFASTSALCRRQG